MSSSTSSTSASSGPLPPPHPDCQTTFEDPKQPGVRHAFGKLSENATIDLSIVVPAYNEEDRLPKMLDEAMSYLEKRRQTANLKYEVIVVDDGSRDATIHVVNRYIAKYSTKNIRLLRMRQNAGKGGAVRAGMLATRGTRCLMADADAATVFDELEPLEHALDNGSHVAIGSRAHLRQSNSGSNTNNNGSEETKEGKRDFIRSFVSFVFHLLVLLVGGVTGLEDTQCGFKLYTRQAARAAFEGQKLSRWAFDVENLYRVQRAGMKITEVPVRWTEIPGSKLSVVKATINMASDMLRMRYNYVTGKWPLPARIN